MIGQHVEFRAFYDADANLWVAISDEDDIATEAGSRDALLQRIRVVVPDVLEARGMGIAGVSVRVAWQEMRTIETTDLTLEAA